MYCMYINFGRTVWKKEESVVGACLICVFSAALSLSLCLSWLSLRTTCSFCGNKHKRHLSPASSLHFRKVHIYVVVVVAAVVVILVLYTPRETPAWLK